MQSIIIEIRAGAGGEEAALFAQNLFNMYSKYATSQGWGFSVLDSSPTGIGGLKQITVEIKGQGAYDKLRYEGGVHRVQRVPKTEKSNRLHTSTVSVAVLKKPEQAEKIAINPNDIKMDFYRSSGKGGQNVNKRQTAIRLTHLPTGIVVTSQTQRNLEQNKQTAMSILQAKLYKIEQQKIESSVAGARKEQIGTMERAEKIRTYNFPQDRLTDHRLNKKWHGIDKILNGKIDKMIKNLQEKLTAKRSP